MPRSGGRRSWWGAIAILVLLGAAAWFWFAARVLVENDPRPSDVILVLDGEYNARPRLALAELRAGLAPRVILDVDDDLSLYDVTIADLARRWIGTLPAPTAAAVSLCMTDSDSTKEEARRARACLGPARRVLLVTSDYHSRRALETFRHVDATRQYSVAAATDPEAFGMDWWEHREWAKQTFDSWARLIWWQLVDRWT